MTAFQTNLPMQHTAAAINAAAVFCNRGLVAQREAIAGVVIEANKQAMPRGINGQWITEHNTETLGDTIRATDTWED